MNISFFRFNKYILTLISFITVLCLSAQSKTQNESYIDREFYNNADFAMRTFEREIDFSDSKFHDTVDFNLSTFGLQANFNSTEFFEPVTFDFALLPDTLLFNSVKSYHNIDLTLTKLKDQKSKCYIDLRYAPIDKFKLRYDKFKVYVPTIVNEEEYEILTNVYEGLLKNFKEMGYANSYEALDKEYRKFQHLRNPSGSSYGVLKNLFQEYWNDYGYQKGWIFYHSLFFFSVFFVINWIKLPQLALGIYVIPTIAIEFKKDRHFKRYWFKKHRLPSINTFTPHLAFFYTALIFFGFNMKPEYFKFKRHFWVYYIYAQYLLGLICVGYLANYVIISNDVGF